MSGVSGRLPNRKDGLHETERLGIDVGLDGNDDAQGMRVKPHDVSLRSSCSLSRPLRECNMKAASKVRLEKVCPYTDFHLYVTKWINVADKMESKQKRS